MAWTGSLRVVALQVIVAHLLLAGPAHAEPARPARPRPFVVADLSDDRDVGLALTFGRAVCDECVAPKIETTALLAFAFADLSIRPGLKLWLSLPVVRRHNTANEFRPERTHTAFGQLTLGLRQLWSVAGAWRPRLSLGASLSGTPRSGASGQADVTLAAARLTSGLPASYFAVTTTTTRLHGDVAISRGPAFAQLGLALLLRAPDERELRSELAFEVLLGAQVSERVALLAEVTAAAFDHSIRCQSSCAPELSGFTSLVSGNLGARVALGRVSLGARLIVPLTDDPSPSYGTDDLSRALVSPSLSVDALARF